MSTFQHRRGGSTCTMDFLKKKVGLGWGWWVMSTWLLHTRPRTRVGPENMDSSRAYGEGMGISGSVSTTSGEWWCQPP